MELIAGRERGDASALRSVLARYPQHAAALVDCDLSLVATSAYADVTTTPEVEAIASAAKRQAFAAVFGALVAAPVVAAASAAASVKELRTAQRLTLKAVAGRLGLGVDVLHALEGGRIRAQSVPRRFLTALGEVLDASAEQLAVLLGAQATINPLFQRAKTGETRGGASAEVSQLEFVEMIRLSTSMTSAQKAAWLNEDLR